MRVFVTGASGAIGRRLVSQPVSKDHEAIGSYRSAAACGMSSG
ncbi:MAG: hypothetical protein WBQ14_09710 [Gaiellaceae bacterium]